MIYAKYEWILRLCRHDGHEYKGENEAGYWEFIAGVLSHVGMHVD